LLVTLNVEESRESITNAYIIFQLGGYRKLPNPDHAADRPG
jgi:hypothetical protein